MSALKSGLQRLQQKEEAGSVSGAPALPGPSSTAVDGAAASSLSTSTTGQSADRVTDSTPAGSKEEEKESEVPSRSPPPPSLSSRSRLSPSPSSPAEFQSYLDHLPEMNLPWQPLRSVTRCSCGRAFTFLVSKVGSM